jgi:selenide, water dikinase
VPWLPGVEQLAASGYVTGASNRNWAGYGQHVTLHGVSDLQRALLTDPQTSGGLLIACAPASVDAVLAVFRAEHFVRAAVIGSLAAGHGITVRG